MLRRVFVSAALMGTLAHLSCSKDRAATIPSYVDVSEISFVEHASGSTHAISEVWAYLDNVFVGAYNIPARFPLVASESSSLEFFAGIRQNATASDLAIYPFYTPHLTTVSGTENQQITPRFAYLSTAVFPFVETFSSTHKLTIDLDQDTQTAFSTQESDGIEGPYGEVSLSADHPTFEVASSQNLAVPSDGRPIFIEFDYRGEMDWQIGIGINGSGIDMDRRYVLQLLPQESWQKVYLALTPSLQGLNVGQIRLVMRGLYDSGRSEIRDQSLQIDNLKIVHFGS